MHNGADEDRGFVAFELVSHSGSTFKNNNNNYLCFVMVLLFMFISARSDMIKIG